MSFFTNFKISSKFKKTYLFGLDTSINTSFRAKLCIRDYLSSVRKYSQFAKWALRDNFSIFHFYMIQC